MAENKLIGVVAIAVFALVIGYLFFTTFASSKDIPPHVTGEVREIYEWARTPEGKAALEQVPCYCGCKYEGHLHARHCYWRDDGTFDKHGITCSVCLDIAKKTRQRLVEGKDLCSIRLEIDEFYKPNAHLGTDTAMPEGCSAA